MAINPLLTTIRAKKLGVLLRDARMASGKSLEECAPRLGVSPDTLEEYELGISSPSLPQLEIYAFYLDLPLFHFWGNATIAAAQSDGSEIDFEKLVNLRHRIVGTLLRQARTLAGLSIEEVARQVGSSSELIRSYELGEEPVPFPQLESLTQVVGKPIEELQDTSGPLADWRTRKRLTGQFCDLTADLQEFVCKPVNRPYLELAQRLSEMSVDKLRRIAEGLLEITL